MKNQIITSITNKIEEARKEKGLSQSELSKKANFSRTYVGQIERGEKDPSLESL